MWQCGKCGEKHQESFGDCWKCGTSRTGEASPDFRAESEISPGESGPCPNCGKGGGYNVWSRYLIAFQCAECGWDNSFDDATRALSAPEHISCPHCSEAMERGAAKLIGFPESGPTRLVFDRGDTERDVISSTARKRRAYSCGECGLLIIW